MASERPPFPVEPEVLAVLETLWSTGHGAYLVGGGVRDRLLGLETTDWDVTTDARPERILELFPGATYENRFGTVSAQGVEITTFRRDHRYADHRRPEKVTFSEDVYEDLARRDLTINAIAWGRRGPDAPARLVDPADGQGDLAARLVRAVGDPALRFDEDALRLLRAVRIAARLGFAIEPVTLAAMTAHAADIAWVSGERVGSEIQGMLRVRRPSYAFELMLATGILAIALPELHALAGEMVEDGRSRLHLALEALDEVVRERDPDGGPDEPSRGERPLGDRIALAALLSEAEPGAARATAERLFISAREADAVVAIIKAVRAPYDDAWSEADVRRYMRTLDRELLDDALSVRECRARVRHEPEALAREHRLQERVAAQRSANVPLSLADLAVDGRDLRDSLGIPEGPAIGHILAALLDDVIEDPALNRRTMLLTRAALAFHDLGDGDSSVKSSGPSATLGR